MTLFSDKNVAHGNVDLVVDIGNSRTCAVLYDNGDFTKVSPLELQDFSNPISKNELNKHTDSFDMRLAFREADLGGNMGIASSIQFNYPSLVRLGKEANRLIHQSVNLNSGAEKTSTFSSAKRYLWDDLPQKQEWEYVQMPEERKKEFYIKGISEQLNFDGSLNLSGTGGTLMQYSRRSLMTLSFLEILAQARRQINSFEQRTHWGNVSQPRRIRKIIVTCPTAMSKVEQIALRNCAEDAAILLNRYYNNSYGDGIDHKEALKDIEIIPSVEDLRKSEKTEWIYDEATAAHFVYLYSEIGERYLKNVNDYFAFYGKHRSDLKGYQRKSLTIGSVDIGAGTTDVMIAAYKNEDEAQCSLTPVPLFWESFSLAGDDLMKELVHQLIIDGKHSPIEKTLKASKRSTEEIAHLYTDFFGGNTGMSFRDRQMRRDFNLQVSVPIVSYFLELLRQNKESEILTFNDIFRENPPAEKILNHFRSHFGFQIEDLQWKYEHQIMSAIVEKTFESLVGKISALFSKYKCDVVLLSGRPCSLKSLTDLFLKYYAISPNRLKTMHDYRVGYWYPQDKRYKFIDGHGYFSNPKSIVTTGAMIANLASKGNLDGFSLNLNELAKKLMPTTEYFGRMNTNTMEFVETIVSPSVNRASVNIATLPINIGSRQINSNAYPNKSFYSLDFDRESIEDRVKGRMDYEDAEDVNRVSRALEEEIQDLRLKMPFTFQIEREYREDKELIKIESVTTADGDDLAKSFFRLQVQSMEEEDFWLDNGIFRLNVNYS